MVVLCNDDVRQDSRVMKEARSLTRNGWHVVVVGLTLGDCSPPQEIVEDDVRVLHVLIPRLLVCFKQMYCRLTRLTRSTLMPIRKIITLLSWISLQPKGAFLLRRLNARVYHAHDFTGLIPLVLAGLWKRAFVYDAHELFFDQWPPGFELSGLDRLWHSIRPLEKFAAQRAIATITVSEGIADRLAETLSIPRPLVVRNMVDRRLSKESGVFFEAGGRKTVIYCGNIAVGRHLPELVTALFYLPDSVALVMMGRDSLSEQLLSLASQADTAERLFFVPPVSSISVAATISQADAAAVLVATETQNYQFALPNKFFEAVAAGLPLVVSQSQEIARMVHEYDLGIVCDASNSQAIAAAIQEILDPVKQVRYRENVAKAREILNWEQEERKLLSLYESILCPGRKDPQSFGY